MSVRWWIVVAGVTGALAVAFGAFGAHVLPGWLQRSGVAPADVVHRMDVFQIGVRYQMVHALALLGVGLLGLAAPSTPRQRLHVAGASFLLGMVLFSGLLVLLALTGIRVLGLIVPVGGVLLIAGWLALAWAAVPSGERT